MNPAPQIIGGATVVAYSPIDERHRFTGGCRQMINGVPQDPVPGLAICQYDGENNFYLFGCDEDWRRKTDTWHRTLIEAMAQGEFEYEGARKTWLNHDTTWVQIQKGERTAVWDLFCEQFQFNPSVRPSDWPGIKEPLESITFNIAHLFDGSDSARAVDLSDLNVEMFNLFRQCTLPGERLYALDWQHPCYWFNPFGRFEGFHWPIYTGMIPVIPDGDYSIFLTADFRFGTFGHPWEQTICLFGDALLDTVGREKPKFLQHVVRRAGMPV